MAIMATMNGQGLRGRRAGLARVRGRCSITMAKASEPVLKIRAGAIAEAALVIQARDVDRAEPWPDGQDRQEDQALPV